ncbi:MAG: transposase [Deltaproteobacteria bacterium]
MTDKLEEVSIYYGARVLSFVLMSNHFHMMIETPLKNLNQIMNYFMREVSRAIGKEASRINHVFGGRYKSSVITESVYFAHAYKYIYRNPVRAHLTTSVDKFPFSTLQWVLGIEPYRFPLYDLNTSFSEKVPLNLSERLGWLNCSPPSEHDLLIRKALRRVEFSFPQDRNCRHSVKSLLNSV